MVWNVLKFYNMVVSGVTYIAYISPGWVQYLVTRVLLHIRGPVHAVVHIQRNVSYLPKFAKTDQSPAK